MSGPAPRSNYIRIHTAVNSEARALSRAVLCYIEHVPCTLDGDLFLDPGLTEPSLPAVGGAKKFDREAPGN